MNIHIPKSQRVPIRVTTLVEDSPNIWIEESTKVIDHNNSSDRKWLGNHCHWALRNARKVVTYSL